LSLASIKALVAKLTHARAQESNKYQYADHESDNMSHSNKVTLTEWEELQSFATQAPDVFVDTNATIEGKGEMTEAKKQAERRNLAKREELMSLINTRAVAGTRKPFEVVSPQTSRDRAKQIKELELAAQKEAESRREQHRGPSTFETLLIIDQRDRRAREAWAAQQAQNGKQNPDAQTQSGAKEVGQQRKHE
jgi:hypothetical protein